MFVFSKPMFFANCFCLLDELGGDKLPSRLGHSFCFNTTTIEIRRTTYFCILRFWKYEPIARGAEGGLLQMR